jgi:aryl-alcohol dehydrogenase-like predicted oxidoreductase
MITRAIPNTKLNPSIICLGTVPIGSSMNEADSFRLFDAYFELGGNFIDTANVYGDWVPGTKSISEKTIGKWIRQRGNRKKVIIATKGAHPNLSTMHLSRLSPEDIIHDINQSLEHLQTDVIDLYWLHRDDMNRNVDEIMEVLHSQVESGKVRYIGCSNWTIRRIAEAQAYAKSKSIPGFVGNQMGWSLAKRNINSMKDHTMVAMDEEGIAFHKKTQLTAIPYSSQANGFFSGKYNQNVIPEKKSVYEQYYNEENFQRLERVAEVAKALSKPKTAIALGYLIAQDFPVFPVIGSNNIQQLKESCLAADIRLDEAMVRYIESGVKSG